MDLIGRLVRKLKARTVTPLRRRRLRRNLPAVAGQREGLVRLGTKYGGWAFIDAPDLPSSTIISAGAGEDISFDLEFARRYNANIVLIDPTPRARAHVTSVMARIHAGEPATGPLLRTGGQIDPWSYDISGLRDGQIRLVPLALWPEEGLVPFYEPVQRVDDSYSIVNLQNSRRSISVNARPLHLILKQQKIDNLPLLKLDIEGAEIEVLRDMMARTIYPEQLLVEFDEMHTPSRRSAKRIHSTIGLLKDHAYRLAHFDGQANFLFIKER
jgi:FkbM family methyltransferase